MEVRAMIGKKVVHHMMMSEKDAHYVGGLVNGARIVVQWGDVGTELMVYADGDISLFLGYEKQCLIVQMRIWKESSIQLQQHVNHQFFAQQEQEVYILRRKTREDHRKNLLKT